MGKRSRYAPGTFSWTDLATTDTDAAKEFYARLFDWSYADRTGDFGTYTEASVEGDAVAGLYAQAEEQRGQGVPPFWLSYVTVEAADPAATRAGELGGQVHSGPFDVVDAGRMAVVADPTGAMLGLWEPKGSIGARRVNDPGSLTWNELSADDVGAAIDFYTGLFGWRVQPIDTGGGPPYWSIGHDDGAGGRNGGMRELAPEEVEHGARPSWLPYFTVASVDEAVSGTGEGGGQVGPVLDLPTGRIAILRDPQGAAFGVFEGEVDD